MYDNTESVLMLRLKCAVAAILCSMATVSGAITIVVTQGNLA